MCVCVCVCVRACARARVWACVHACACVFSRTRACPRGRARVCVRTAPQCKDDVTRHNEEVEKNGLILCWFIDAVCYLANEKLLL